MKRALMIGSTVAIAMMIAASAIRVSARKGVEMLAVPRNPDGPDVVILEKLAAAHRPKVYFTQSVMQNPTGTDMSPHVAFKILQAAERHNFTVVEDDIFCDLQVKTTPRLATLDQLNRVIYARSFSKTLSGSLRVGFVACSRHIAESPYCAFLNGRLEDPRSLAGVYDRAEPIEPDKAKCLAWWDFSAEISTDRIIDRGPQGLH